MSVGDSSMMILQQSLKMGTVVIRTRTEKRYVQMGSAIFQSGLITMMIAAAMTPMLYTMSPII